MALDTSQLSQASAIATVGQILRATQTVSGSVPLHLKNHNPKQPSDRLRNLIVVDDLLAGDFLSPQAPAIVLPAKQGYTTQLSDRHTPPGFPNPGQTESTLLQLFIRGNPFRGSAGLTQASQGLLNRLIRAKDLQAVIIYGSPYVLKQFLPMLPTEIPCIFTYGQMPLAQAFALEKLFDS